MAKERNLHQKESFLQGNRQRWLVVFLACMFVILTLDAVNVISRVDSYLTFLTFLSGAFILGYSGTETMKLFSVNSTSSNQTISQETHIVNETLTHNAKEEDYKV